MQHGNFDINDYFPGGSADIERIERDFQSGIFNHNQINQIINELEREIRGLRGDIKKSNRLNKILGIITVIGIIIGIIGIILYFLGKSI